MLERQDRAETLAGIFRGRSSLGEVPKPNFGRNMVFRVELSPDTVEDLDTIATHIGERGSFENPELCLMESSRLSGASTEPPTRTSAERA
jgi:hypothetical protein